MLKKEYPFKVPENKMVRVIIDTDAACEGDDQFAIAHALLTPKFDIRGIVAEHFLPDLGVKHGSMEKSYEEILNVLDLMDLSEKYPVYKGVEEALEDEKTPIGSEGARFIVEEAMREGETRPLYVLCQGAITNLADALLLEPKIAKKMTVIWIGGATYPAGGWEFNCLGDVNAVNVVMDSDVPLWQVPMNIYSMMKVTFAELYQKVYPCGKIGKYMVEKLVKVSEHCSQFDLSPSYPPGESWQLGDSPVIGLLLTDHTYHYDDVPAPRVDKKGYYQPRPENSRKIRVYNYIDSHFILNDMYAKLEFSYRD